MNVALLIGSGVSKGCGLPDVNDLTNALFDEKWQRQIDTLPAINKLTPDSRIECTAEQQKQETLIRTQTFLKAIYTLANRILKKYNDSPVNYEHLHEITTLLNHRRYYSKINPASIFQYEFLVDLLHEHLVSLPISPNKENDISYMAFLARKLINDIIRKELETKEINADYNKLGVLSELAYNPLIDKLDIFTTNHDRLIENLLSNNNIEFADGFGKPIDGIRRLNFNAYDSDSKLDIYKLHGTIDWYIFSYKDFNAPQNFLGIPVEKDIYQYMNTDDNIFSPINAESNFLTGLTTKTLDYELEPFSEIVFRFQNRLEDHDVLIESGYGWSDISLNRKLQRWIGSNNSRKIICLHKNPEKEIKKNPVNFLAHYYDQLVSTGKLIFPLKEGTNEGKWLSECSCEELLTYCNC